MSEEPASGRQPTILVTGAQEASAKRSRLSSANGRTGLVGARTERGEAAADRIRSHVSDADLQVVAGDLSLMRDVRSLTYQVVDSTPRLDGLILSAAEAAAILCSPTRASRPTSPPIHLAGFLLAHLLLPVLRPGGPARIIAVSRRRSIPASRWWI